MSDAVQVAKDRRQKYTKPISNLEAEIAELKEMISDLDNFIEFGEALVGKGADNKPKNATGNTAENVTPKQRVTSVQSTPADLLKSVAQQAS